MYEFLVAGGAGRQASRDFSGLYDTIIRELWEQALDRLPEAAGLALVATGGWGREEMCPFSGHRFHPPGQPGSG